MSEKQRDVLRRVTKKLNREFRIDNGHVQCFNKVTHDAQREYKSVKSAIEGETSIMDFAQEGLDAEAPAEGITQKFSD